MSHHGHEESMQQFYAECDRERLPVAEEKLRSAVALITAVAQNEFVDPGCECDTWLEANGYECEASRRRQRERRADELDKEIERLRAERAALK